MNTHTHFKPHNHPHSCQPHHSSGPKQPALPWCSPWPHHRPPCHPGPTSHTPECGCCQNRTQSSCWGIPLSSPGDQITSDLMQLNSHTHNTEWSDMRWTLLNKLSIYPFPCDSHPSPFHNSLPSTHHVHLEPPHVRAAQVLILECQLYQLQRHRLGLHGVHNDVLVVAELEGGGDALLNAYGVYGRREVCFINRSMFIVLICR